LGVKLKNFKTNNHYVKRVEIKGYNQSRVRVKLKRIQNIKVDWVPLQSSNDLQPN
jgi:hypothetical protein